MGNGDYLAAELGKGSDNPPIVYLSHDGDSRLLAPSLMDFLKVWEQLCYIGPELWMLEPFLDSETGYLRADTKDAALLRDLFRETPRIE